MSKFPAFKWPAEATLRKIGYGLIAFLLTLTILALGGERFAPVLEFFGLKGLYNREKGAYADCSLEENRNSPYCSPTPSKADQEWKDLKNSGGRSYPFRLSE